MANGGSLPGVDWEQVLAELRRAAAGCGATNRVVAREARAGLDALFAEVNREVERCRLFEERSRAFEGAMTRLAAAERALSEEAPGLPEGVLAALVPKLLSPLTSIRTFCEIMADNATLPLDQRNAFLEIAVREADRLSRTIAGIVDLARIRSGRLAWAMAPVAVSDALDDAVATVRPLFEDKGVALERTVPADLPLVHADRSRLAQVVANLLANAAKFANAGTGRVALAAAADDGAVRVEVTDDGPGVAPERRHIIFARFLELDDTLSDEPRGTGLGLALAREIVAHFGGRIWVDDAPGGGARFAFTVPHA